MSDILKAIADRLRTELPERKRRRPQRELERQIGDLPPARDFAAALTAGDGVRVIAEVKQASPSKGVIRADFRPAALAAELEAAGAAALSVLTEPNYFLGSLDHLTAIADGAAIPVLRKDFIFDVYQLYEARAAGADAVLLIAALLADADFAQLHREAAALGLQILGEAHDAAELDRLLAGGVRIVGVNARDLHTFDTSLDRVAALLARVPAGCVRVAESAIRRPEEIACLRAAGADAFLIGETLMRAASPGKKLRELRCVPK